MVIGNPLWLLLRQQHFIQIEAVTLTFQNKSMTSNHNTS